MTGFLKRILVLALLLGSHHSLQARGAAPLQSTQPTVAQITPFFGVIGTTSDVTIGGTNLVGVTAVTFAGGDVTATIKSAGTPDSLLVSISIAPNATLGSHSLTVTTLAGSVSCNCFTVVPKSWTLTSSMGTARRFHTVTLLQDGKVLAAGGRTSTTEVTNNSELYDPNTGNWVSTGAMNTARAVHTATLLPDGKVLILGGVDNSSTPLASAELYDPSSGTWSSTASMAYSRVGHSATLLQNGKVLVVGSGPAFGFTTGEGNSEIYDRTFDGFLGHFLFSLGGVQGVNVKPVVVDSWDTLGIEIRLSGRQAFRGEAPSLDLFNATDNRIDPAAIGMQALRDHVTRNQAAYQQEAARRRAVLRRRGYFSAADVRVEVLQRLRRNDWSAVMGRSLVARFAEVIVDEGQDCNPLDCLILTWLRNAGVPVTVVADPDQAIYGFRHGNPTDLQAIANSYPQEDRLALTGNFRSGPAICAVAATLRQRADPDVSLGDAAQFLEPVHVVAYTGHMATDDVGAFFLARLRDSGISPSRSLVLAHGRRNAFRICGSGAEEDVGTSKVARLAGAVGMLWVSSTSSRGRERALRISERMILELMGAIADGEEPSSAAEKRNIDRRWLRRVALALLTGVPRSCDDTDDARAAWVEQLHRQVRALRLSYRPGVTERGYFQSRPGATWHRCFLDTEAAALTAATVHEAKGRQYDAICLVIPPDNRGRMRTHQLVQNWENRVDDEAKRVIYVGLTRARRLAVLAIPEAVRERVSRIFDATRAEYRMHQI